MPAPLPFNPRAPTTAVRFLRQRLVSVWADGWIAVGGLPSPACSHRPVASKASASKPPDIGLRPRLACRSKDGLTCQPPKPGRRGYPTFWTCQKPP